MEEQRREGLPCACDVRPATFRIPQHQRQDLGSFTSMERRSCQQRHEAAAVGALPTKDAYWGSFQCFIYKTALRHPCDSAVCGQMETEATLEIPYSASDIWETFRKAALLIILMNNA